MSVNIICVDEKTDIAEFAEASNKLIKTWGWQNPNTEPPKPGAYYHFISVKGKLTSGYYYAKDISRKLCVGDVNKGGKQVFIVPVLYKSMSKK